MSIRYHEIMALDRHADFFILIHKEIDSEFFIKFIARVRNKRWTFNKNRLINVMLMILDPVI